MSTTSRAALPLSLLLLGHGHVAQAFLPLLASRSEWLDRELGIRPLINGIGTHSRGFFVHPQGIYADLLAHEPDPIRCFHDAGMSVHNAEAFIATGKAAGASLLIELTTLNPHDGEPALSHIHQALEAGMDVITANKGPVAHAQAELQTLARRQQRQFRFESTVMDGLPLLNLAQFTLPAAGIRSFRALLNTTTSLVLSRIAQGLSREEAIREAQHIGVAEADPSYDLDGWDAAMKTTILINNLLNGHFTPTMVQREGIQHLTPQEIRSAAQEGTPIRLVSEAHHEHGALVATVQPRRLAKDDPLHVAQGTVSVITLETEAMGSITLIEHESGVLQTAYGVLSDLINIERKNHAYFR